MGSEREKLRSLTLTLGRWGADIGGFPMKATQARGGGPKAAGSGPLPLNTLMEPRHSRTNHRATT